MWFVEETLQELSEIYVFVTGNVRKGAYCKEKTLKLKSGPKVEFLGAWGGGGGICARFS